MRRLVSVFAFSSSNFKRSQGLVFLTSNPDRQRGIRIQPSSEFEYHK